MKKVRTCIECGSGMRSSREVHRHTITPKWSITIENAEVLRCPKCGTWEVVIPKPDALQRAIAAEVIRKPEGLSGSELTFLRRCLGLTGRAMARALGVAHESLSRWENEARGLRVPATVDHLARTMVALKLFKGGRFPVETLASISGDAGPLKLVLTFDAKSGEWHVSAKSLKHAA